MRRGGLALVVLGGASLFAFEAAGQAVPTAIVDANVIPMDYARVLTHQTVVVRDGRVVAMGPNDAVVVPSGAEVIDAAGRYLIPGLADMHTHFSRPEDLDLFVANGVTSVRLMWGTPESVRWRDRIAAGHLLGPRMYVAGPIMEGTPPPEFAGVIATEGRSILDTHAQALIEVARQHAAGFDFLKVYNNLNRDAYTGIVEEARARRMPVAGHVPFDVGLEGVFEARQRSIEHLRGYIWQVVPSDAPQPPGRDLRSRSLAWRHADITQFRALATATREAGVWNVPTLSVQIYLAPQEQVDRYLQRPEAEFLTAPMRAVFKDREQIPWLSNFDVEDYRAASEGHAVQMALIRELHRAGAKLMAGTDIAPNGFSLHRELENLVAAGLTPFDALVTATRNPAEFFQQDDLGTIGEGKRADLVLLNGNPLDDIRNTARIEGVMVQGRWLSRDRLTMMLERLRPK
jgi:hypothetical protein